jgi:hypothetical protein
MQSGVLGVVSDETLDARGRHERRIIDWHTSGLIGHECVTCVFRRLKSQLETCKQLPIYTASGIYIYSCLRN